MRNAIDNNNSTMQKWLGMNILGQTDKSEQKVTEKVVYVSDASHMTETEIDKEIKELEALERELDEQNDSEADQRAEVGPAEGKEAEAGQGE